MIGHGAGLAIDFGAVEGLVVLTPANVTHPAPVVIDDFIPAVTGAVAFSLVEQEQAVEMAARGIRYFGILGLAVTRGIVFLGTNSHDRFQLGLQLQTVPVTGGVLEGTAHRGGQCAVTEIFLIHEFDPRPQGALEGASGHGLVETGRLHRSHPRRVQTHGHRQCNNTVTCYFFQHYQYPLLLSVKNLDNIPANLNFLYQISCQA